VGRSLRMVGSFANCSIRRVGHLGVVAGGIKPSAIIARRGVNCKQALRFVDGFTHPNGKSKGTHFAFSQPLTLARSPECLWRRPGNRYGQTWAAQSQEEGSGARPYYKTLT